MTEEQYFQNYIIRHNIKIRDDSHELCIRAFTPYLFSYCANKEKLLQLLTRLTGKEHEFFASIESFNGVFIQKAKISPYFVDLFIELHDGLRYYIYYINCEEDFARLDEALALNLAGSILAVYGGIDPAGIIDYFVKYGILFVDADLL